MARILIIDDDVQINRLIAKSLDSAKHSVKSAYTLEQGLEVAGAHEFDVIFLDLVLPDGNGLSSLASFLHYSDWPEIVIITGINDEEGVEYAIETGAFSYLQKPLTPKDIRLTCDRALEFRNCRLQKRKNPDFSCSGVVGQSLKLKECASALARAAAGFHNILITGETGTGKELMARAVHENSAQAKNNFIIVDCAALKDTLLENTLFGHEKGAFTGADYAQEGLVSLAHEGTLFLDEIGELELEQQKKFLRLLEDKRFYPLGGKTEKHSDFRLVTATNRDLSAMVESNEFRSDLYYRIRGQQIHIPPLRERKEDICDLVFYYTEKICHRMQIPAKKVYEEFLDALARFDYPGNIRELVNLLDEVISSFPDDPGLQIRHLPAWMRVKLVGPEKKKIDRRSLKAEFIEGSNDFSLSSEMPPKWKNFRKLMLDHAEKKYFQKIFELSQGRVKEMALMADLTQARVYDIIKKHNFA